jgi:hypothetical protein
MSPVSLSPSSLKEGRLHEYLIRFALGGAATVFTGFISSRCGASIGGLFLALPAIFCASATLIEKHEIRRKREAGWMAGPGRRGGGAGIGWHRARCLRYAGICAHVFADGARQHSDSVHRGIARMGDRLDHGLVRPP